MKYVFRNGVEQALRLTVARPDLPVKATITSDAIFGRQSAIDPAACSLTWRYQGDKSTSVIQ